MSIEAQLVDYFREHHDATVTAETPLVEQGIVDSMGVMELVTYLENTFGVEFEMDDLTIDKLGSIASIKNLIMSKRGEA